MYNLLRIRFQLCKWRKDVVELVVVVDYDDDGENQDNVCYIRRRSGDEVGIKKMIMNVSMNNVNSAFSFSKVIIQVNILYIIVINVLLCK